MASGRPETAAGGRLSRLSCRQPRHRHDAMDRDVGAGRTGPLRTGGRGVPCPGRGDRDRRPHTQSRRVLQNPGDFRCGLSSPRWPLSASSPPGNASLAGELFGGALQYRADGDCSRIHGGQSAVHPSPSTPGNRCPVSSGTTPVFCGPIIASRVRGWVHSGWRQFAGAYGDLALHDANNLWTGWIIQIAAIIVALRFTRWYPEVVRARSLRERGLPGPPEPPLSSMLLPAGGLSDPGRHCGARLQRRADMAGHRADRGGGECCWSSR